MSRGPQLLTVDAGNTTLDCVRHDTGERAAFAAAAADAFAAFVLAAAPARCVAVCVVEPVRQRILASLGALGIPLRFAGVDLPCPLALDYDTPATLGADRWVAALAAYAEFGAAIVVDCGTATTVNIVDAGGIFRGGAIAPGLRAFVAGMANVTPALPTPDLDARGAMPPRTTQSAVDSGVLIGYAGLVERLVADARSVAADARVVVTGGNAARLLAHSRLEPLHVADLIHRGLRRLDQPA